MCENLLVAIARCGMVCDRLRGEDPRHSCAAVVDAQRTEGVPLDEHQVPEPWSGKIESAPILFLSSNPSMSMADVYPSREWSDPQVIDFFQNRFAGGRREWIKDGRRALGWDGTYLPATAFWSAVRKRAEELLERPARPGIDYALTEVVHCKSKAESGVRDALRFCAARFLNPVINVSSAPVVVVLGRLAGNVVRERFGIGKDCSIIGPVSWGGMGRLIAFLPHPNARVERTFARCMAPGELARLRAMLDEGR